jgi:phosphoribosylglycinamide formyltransferase-1
MRLLSPGFIQAFPDRIVNIHPSLLPAFPGLDAQRQAIAAGVMESGCTVHFVDEDLDAGPVILQRTVPVLEGDTVETLSARILEQEHPAYVEAVRKIVSERSRPAGG